MCRRQTPFISISRSAPFYSRNEILTLSASRPFALSDLAQNRPNPFEVTPDQSALTDLARDLDLLGLRKLRFSGQITGEGRRDWRLSAHLGATVVQPCVLTLAPVTTRIEADVTRLYMADYVEPEDAEAEMPEDDSVEPLPESLDLMAVLAEALALNLPLYPKADGAALEESNFTEPGKAAMTDQDARPFAGLAALRDQLKSEE